MVEAMFAGDGEDPERLVTAFGVADGEVSRIAGYHTRREMTAAHWDGTVLVVSIVRSVSVRCSVAAGGVELYAGMAQVRHDLLRIASTTGSLATVLLNSSATATRIFSGTVTVEPLTTTAAGTKIV